MVKMFHWKKLAAITAILLIAVVSVSFARSFPQFSEEEVRLAYTTKQTGYRIVKEWDIPQSFLVDAGRHEKYTSLPGDVKRTLWKYVRGKYEYNFSLVGFVNQVEDEIYNILLLLSWMDNPSSVKQIKHLEFIVNGKNIEAVREVMPEKISETSETYEKEWQGTVDTREESVTSKIVIEESVVTYSIELESASLVEIEAWTTIEGKNIFGWTLWSLTAKGLFGVYINYAVLWVIDESSVWANGWLGGYENFSHYSKIYFNGLFGLVRAESDFYGPFWQFVHAWAWVRVWYNGEVDGNART